MSSGKFFRLFLLVLFVLLVVLAAGLWFRAHSLAQTLAAQQTATKDVQFKQNVLHFMRLFLEKVLNAKGEIGFEDRLRLETAVRDLHDSEILTEWNLFVNSKTELEAQEAVKNLLTDLANKI